MSSNLIETKDLTKHFPLERGLLSSLTSRERDERVVHAVCEVSLSIRKGQTLALVGESGSGKTTFGRCLLRLIEPTSGKILFEGVDLLSLDKEQLRKFRKNMQMIFQDPFQSLSPRMRVEEIIGGPMQLHGIASGAEKRKKVGELLATVGLKPDHAQMYPHQFSGGQRQRIGIARALSVDPKFVVADEAVSSLDVSVQAQILNLMRDIQTKFNLTYLFITHNLSIVRFIGDRIAVMYLGKLVEEGSVEEILSSPKHPYTQALVASVPIADPRKREVKRHLAGEVPSALDPPSGCRFRTRCPYVMQVCSQEEPPLKVSSDGRAVACHLY